LSIQKVQGEVRDLAYNALQAWPWRRLHKLDPDALAGALIFLLTVAIFLASPVHQIADSRFSMLVSESLIQRRTFTLDHYRIPGLAPVVTHGSASNTSIYQIEHVNGRFYHFFPPGSPVLSIPYVALLNLCGISATHPDGSYNQRGEGIIQGSLAALLMAALAAVFFYTARLLLPLSWSVWLALGGALGTQVWSTASRALWTDTWGTLLLGLVLLSVLADAVGKRRLEPIQLATLLSWAYFVRPTYSIQIVALTIYILIYRRQLFLRFASTGAAWGAAFVAYSLFHYGKLLPTYYYLVNQLSFASFPTAFAGNLISPSRGLLVYVPVLGFVVYLQLRFARWNTHARLSLLALAVCAAHLLLIAGFTPWWGGHAYGPRYTTGIVPWLVLLGVLGLKALFEWSGADAPESGRRRVATLYFGAALLVLSILINMRGATSHAAWRWNVYPQNVDQYPERVWDWRQPQFLATPAAASQSEAFSQP
jgi:hypothetical protein